MALWVGLAGAGCATATPVGSPAGNTLSESRRVIETSSKIEFPTRDLRDYLNYFGPALKTHLDALGPDAHWLDAGSEDAFAQREYLGSRDGKMIIAGRPRMTAVTLTAKKETPRELAGGRFRLLVGRTFEAIPESEFGQVDVITDLCGVINYTEHPDEVLQKYLRILKPDGSIFIFLPIGMTQIHVPNGAGTKKVSLRDWIASIPGLVVIPLFPKTSPFPAIWAFEVRRTAREPAVPRLVLIRAEWTRANALYRDFQAF